MWIAEEAVGGCALEAKSADKLYYVNHLARVAQVRQPTSSRVSGKSSLRFGRCSKRVHPSYPLGRALNCTASGRFATFVEGHETTWELNELLGLGCPMNGQALIKLWFNADLFHGDAAKQTRLQELAAEFGARQVLIWQRFALAAAIGRVVNLHMFLRDQTDAYQRECFQGVPESTVSPEV